MQETTHTRHFQNVGFSLWIELFPELALPSGLLYQQLLEKVLICTLPKIWVYQPESPIWHCLCPPQVKPKECSQIQQPHWQGDTVVISRAPGAWHEDCQEHDVVRNMRVLIKPWAVAERVPSSCSQLKEAALSWSQALDPIPSAHSAWGRGHKLQVFKPSHCHSENAPGSLRSQFFL